MCDLMISEDIIRAFREALVRSEKSRATVEKYIRDVWAFQRFCGGVLVTKELVLEYKSKLQSDGYAVRSINSMLASINSLLAFQNRQDLKVKPIRMQQEVFRREEKELTKAEYKRLCQTAKGRQNTQLELIMQTICATGIRVSELKYITVESVRKGEAEVSCKGKIRKIFIVKDLQKKLLRFAAFHGREAGVLFLTKQGLPVNRTSVWRGMKNLCEEAGIAPDKVFPHNLRHLFARVFYEMEKDIAKLADILGHSSVNTTRIYILSTGMEHRRQMEKMRLIL